MATEVEIIEVSGTELYHRYPGQTSAQDCYVELDVRSGQLTAKTNGEIGNARPAEVHYGHVQRWSIPALKASAANDLLEQIRPFAERVRDGYETEWNGNSGNQVAMFNLDAQDAIDDIVSLCSNTSLDDELAVWEASDWLYGLGSSMHSQAEVLEITATTTDDQLNAIEQKLIKHAATDDVDVVEGLGEYLKRLRNEARNESRESTENASATL